MPHCLVVMKKWHNGEGSPFPLAKAGKMAAIAFGLWLGAVGCKTAPPRDLRELDAGKSDAMVLHEGDSVRISFPGAPNLNTAQQIRRDGRLALPLVGELKAAGMTPAELEKELLKLYDAQLQAKEVTVTVESSTFPVYLTGAVLRPGKIVSDRPLNALEAIMEAGVDYTKADLRAVTVIRHENGRSQHYVLNLKSVLKGEQSEPFALKRSDIIYVPEKYSWF